MKKYAMTLRNKCIGVVEGNKPPKWGNDPIGNEVIAIECDENVSVGMLFNPKTHEFEDEKNEPIKITSKIREDPILLNQEEIRVALEYVTCILETNNL